MAHAKDRLIRDIDISKVRQIGPAEAAQIYSEMNYEKHGVVAGFRTTPQRFRDYMRRRRAADQQAKHGRSLDSRSTAL